MSAAEKRDCANVSADAVNLVKLLAQPRNHALQNKDFDKRFALFFRHFFDFLISYLQTFAVKFGLAAQHRSFLPCCLKFALQPKLCAVQTKQRNGRGNEEKESCRKISLLGIGQPSENRKFFAVWGSGPMDFGFSHFEKRKKLHSVVFVCVDAFVLHVFVGASACPPKNLMAAGTSRFFRSSSEDGVMFSFVISRVDSTCFSPLPSIRGALLIIATLKIKFAFVCEF
ncbi:MAG: hypothetical protein ACOYD9_05850 [Pyramidobacter sp.]|jgi:hypothetical protein